MRKGKRCATPTTRRVVYSVSSTAAGTASRVMKDIDPEESKAFILPQQESSPRRNTEVVYRSVKYLSDEDRKGQQYLLPSTAKDVVPNGAAGQEASVPPPTLLEQAVAAAFYAAASLLVIFVNKVRKKYGIIVVVVYALWCVYYISVSPHM